MGAVAANRYRGDARFTTDLDLLVSPDARIPEALRQAGYTVTEIADPDEPPHLLIARRDRVRVDILPAVVRYQEVALGRADDHFLTVEDVIIHKLVAWRLRDRDDVRSILETGRELDLAYVREWADAWDVTERWSDILPRDR